MKLKTYFKDLYKVFTKSIKIFMDKKSFLIVFYDLLCYSSLFLGIFAIGLLFQLIASSNVGVISQLQQGTNALSLDQLQNVLLNAKSLLFLVILAIVIVVVYGIIILSLFKGLIWKKILNEKFSKKFFGKFILVNLIWLIPVAALLFASVILMASILQDKLLLMQFVKWPINIIIYLTLYFHVLFTFNLAMTDKIKESLKNMFHFGIAKFHYLILPIVIILLLVLGISKLYVLLAIKNPTFNLILYVIIISFYFVFSRIFYINVIKEFILKEKKNKKVF
jgi:hypothetical protein